MFLISKWLFCISLHMRHSVYVAFGKLLIMCAASSRTSGLESLGCSSIHVRFLYGRKEKMSEKKKIELDLLLSF